MKKGLFLLSLFSFLVISGCGWSDAQQYNDAIVNIVKKCTDANNDSYFNYNQAEATVDEILLLMQTNVEICKSSINEIEKLWSFKKDSSLKDATIKFLSENIDYLELIMSTSQYRNQSTITDEDRMAYVSVLNELTQKQENLRIALDDLPKVQKTFASKYNVKLDGMDDASVEISSMDNQWSLQEVDAPSFNQQVSDDGVVREESLDQDKEADFDSAQMMESVDE